MFHKIFIRNKLDMMSEIPKCPLSVFPSFRLFTSSCPNSKYPSLSSDNRSLSSDNPPLSSNNPPLLSDNAGLSILKKNLKKKT